MIILRQKEFNSKAQKEMRRVLDFKSGAKGLGELESLSDDKIKQIIKKSENKKSYMGGGVGSLIKLGRIRNKKEYEKISNIGSTIDSSINSKSVNRGGFGPTVKGETYKPTAHGLRLSPRSIRHLSKKQIKSDDLYTYDHGNSSPSWNKEVMELTKYNKEKK